MPLKRNNLKSQAISLMAIIGIVLAATAIMSTPNQTETLINLSHHLMDSTLISFVISIPSLFS